MVISTDTEKLFEKFNNLSDKSNQLTRNTKEVPWPNNKKNSELISHLIVKLDAFPLRSVTWQRCVFLSLLFHIVLEILTRVVR